MGAVTFYSQTDEVAGELANGIKLVYTTIITDTGTTAAVPVTINPLRRIIDWTMGVRTLAGATSGYAYQAVKYAANASGTDNSIDVFIPEGTVSGTVINLVTLGV